MPETITVTVSVDMADVLDVLAWHESTDYGWEHHELKPANDRWLAAYQDLDGDDREELWRSMPASLQWCLHELEQRGVTPLWWALSAAGQPDPRLSVLEPATESEWEYGATHVDARRPVTLSDTLAEGRDAQAFYTKLRGRPTELLRRSKAVPAGPWQEVAADA